MTSRTVRTILLSPFLFLSFIGFKIRKRFYSPDKIREYQKERAKSIAKYAERHSLFFEHLYEGKRTDDFFNLPRTNKTMMMDNLTDYNTLGLKKEDLIEFALKIEKDREFDKRFNDINIGMSSGTSGNKGIIITTLKEELYAKTMYLARLTLPEKEKLNCAFILRVNTPGFNFSSFGHKLTYVSQLMPMENIIGKLHNVNPNVLSGPPSMLKLLAEEKNKGKLKISPKMIYSYAEVLYDDVKKILEDIFKCPIHQIYQGSEGYYAVTCKYGKLHINEDMVLLELLDHYGKETEEGKPCERLLVTDLFKTSQPIIRYELNDIITISKERCKCGSCFRVIEEIQGRADDMFFGLRNKTKEIQFIFQDYISRAIISASEDIREYQAVQEDYTYILIRILVSKKVNRKILSQDLTNRLKGIFQKYDCILPKVKVIYEAPELNPNSQKMIRIKCNIKKGK